MERPTIGSVVLIPFPFSDLTESKLRPALILAKINKHDLVFCQITSNSYADHLAIEITDKSFDRGSLARISYIRPGKLFTGHSDLIMKTVGTLKLESFKKVIRSVNTIFQSSVKTLASLKFEKP